MVPPSLDYTEDVLTEEDGKVRSMVTDGSRLAALVVHAGRPQSLALYVKEDATWSQLARIEYDEISAEDVEVAFTLNGDFVVAGEHDLLEPSGDGETFRIIDLAGSVGPFTFVYRGEDELLLGAGEVGQLYRGRSGASSLRYAGVDVSRSIDAVVAYRGGYVIGAATWLGYVRFDDPPLVCAFPASGARIHSISSLEEGLLVGGRFDDDTAFFWYDHFLPE